MHNDDDRIKLHDKKKEERADKLEERLDETLDGLKGVIVRIDQLEEKIEDRMGLEKRLNETSDGMKGAIDRINLLEKNDVLKELDKRSIKTIDRIDQLEEKIEDRMGLEKRLNEITDGMKGATGRIDELGEKIEAIIGLERRLNEMTDGMKGTTSRIDELGEKIEVVMGLEKRLDETSDGVKGTIDRINLLEEKIKDITEFEKRLITTTNKTDQLGEKIEEVMGIERRLNETADGMKGTIDSIDQLLRRMKHLEGMTGVTTGDEVVKFDSQGILKKVLSDFLGEEKASQLIPEEKIEDPIILVKTLKTAIGTFGYIDQENRPDTIEIMLQYADQVDSSDKMGIILTYSKDFRKILESGQAVLASIGKQKVKTRSIMEETKNMTRKWKDEIDVKSSEHGIPKVLELLTDLENIFMQ
ncbi:MAG: hypothetical protein ACXAEU_19395 [Candidatus Hodarchaeales archaeon]|jgi:CII-binding regulator of phage lambda lysogenization HflD